MVPGADDTDLIRADAFPLGQQMAQHGTSSPGQQQFRTAHARGEACGKNDNAQVQSLMPYS
jgi:hypothetical protein